MSDIGIDLQELIAKFLTKASAVIHIFQKAFGAFRFIVAIMPRIKQRKRINLVFGIFLSDTMLNQCAEAVYAAGNTGSLMGKVKS